MEQNEMNELIADYQRLFYKVLRRCSIFPGQADYEDAMQDLRLKFFLKAQAYESRGLFEAENKVGYLFQYLLWSVIDQKRKVDPHDYEIQDEDLLAFQKIEAPFDEVETAEMFAQFCQQMKPKERAKAEALVSDVSLTRQQRHRYRTYMKEHFRDFFEKV